MVQISLKFIHTFPTDNPHRQAAAIFESEIGIGRVVEKNY